MQCLPDQPLSAAERSVVDYINKQRLIINLLSISDIAEGAFVSNATVSRAIRKCGFSSLSEMKFRMAEDDKTTPGAYEMNRILSRSYEECLETLKSIDIPTVVEVVRRLRRARRVFLLANGLTALIAEEFALQLQCQHVNAFVISDTEMMLRLGQLLDERDAVFVLSVKCSREELATGARSAKRQGATVMGACCTVGTPLDDVCELLVRGFAKEIQPNRSFGGVSRLGLLIITRTIVEYMDANINDQ